jgi:hypothetical protein
MKKIKYLIILLAFSGCILTNDVFAEKGPTDPMSVDSWTINFGLGAGIHYYSGYATGFGPGIQFAFEKGMWQLGPGVLTLGGEMGFSYFTYTGYYGGYHHGGVYYPDFSYKYTWLNFIMACRSAYHYGWKVPGLDTYGGLAMGFRFVSFTSSYADYYNGYYGTYEPAAFNFFPGFFVGGSYFFNHAIGVNAELGFNVNYAQIGMIFKLK